MQLKGIFQEKSDYHKFLILVMLVLLSTGVFMVFWYMSLPAFGIDLIKNPNAIVDFNNPSVIKAISVWQTVQAFATFIIPAVLMVWLTSNIDPRKYLHIDAKPNFKALLVAGLMMLVAMPFINWMGYVNSKMSLPEGLQSVETWMKNAEAQAMELTKALLNITSTGDLIFKIIMMALLPAIGEELLFRGVIQRLFVKWISNVNVSIILTAVLFSAMHMQFYGFIPRMVMGVGLGYMLAFTGNLWVPIFAHFINNASVILFTYWGWTGAEAIGTESNDFLVTLLSMAASIGLMYVLSKKSESFKLYS